MIWVGGLIVIVTFAAILKNLETRMILILSGVVMAACAAMTGVEGCLNGVFDAFSAQLINTSLVPTIYTCMGFCAVMEYTGCIENLIRLLTAPLRRVRAAVVPGAVIITWVINIVVISAAGCAAAVGSLLIPMMIGMGIHPITAAACILIGTWGNCLSPGLSFNAQVAELAGTTPMDVISQSAPMLVVGMVIATGILTVIDWMLQKKAIGAGEKRASAVSEEHSAEKINIVKAMIPVLPLVFLVMGTVGLIPNLDVTAWMLIGCAIGILTDVKRAQEGCKQCFAGMGNAYRDIITLMAAAAVFTFGMQAIGLTDALVEIMKNSTSIARLGAGLGPFIIAALSGSGNAATIAFNNAVTPFAADFGYTLETMGMLATVAGAVGRAASPVAGVTIVCAKLAGVSPMDVVKRSMAPMLFVAVFFMFVLI